MQNWSVETQHLVAASRLMIGGAGLTLLLYWAGVCPVLYRHGARFPTGVALHRFMKDLRCYQALQRAGGRTCDLYYALLLLTVFTAGTVAVAVVVWLNDWWLKS